MWKGNVVHVTIRNFHARVNGKCIWKKFPGICYNVNQKNDINLSSTAQHILQQQQRWWKRIQCLGLYILSNVNICGEYNFFRCSKFRKPTTIDQKKFTFLIFKQFKTSNFWVFYYSKWMMKKAQKFFIRLI
jgi:hypothetical protein